LPNQGSPEGKKKPHHLREWIAMLAVIEGHPNVDAVVFYILACAILTVTLYRHHRKTP
jgi:hypothetical protein